MPRPLVSSGGKKPRQLGLHFPTSVVTVLGAREHGQGEIAQGVRLSQALAPLGEEFLPLGFDGNQEIKWWHCL
jgi:hypothetical protein